MSGTVHDVLSQIAAAATISEADGVRWITLVYPPEISVPGYAVATVLLQNVMDRSRIADLTIERSAFFAERVRAPVALNPGEAGMFRVPIYLRQEIPIGRYELRPQLQVRPPHEVGRRLLHVAPSSTPPFRPAIRVVSSHGLPPVNLFAYDWSGFVSLYLPPQTAPDLSPLQVIQELPAAPSAPGSPR